GRFIPRRFVRWRRLTTRRSRLQRGHRSHPIPHGGTSVFLIFTRLSLSLTVFLPASLPTRIRATSTLFSLILLLLVAVLLPVFISASNRHCARPAPRGSPPTSV